MNTPKLDRNLLLSFIYETARGITHRDVPLDAMQAHFGWDGERLDAAISYLSGAHLIKGMSLRSWAITTEGIDRVEETTEPATGSTNSHPGSVVFNGPIHGQVQIGNNNEATLNVSSAQKHRVAAPIIEALLEAGPTSGTLDRYIALLQMPNPSSQEITNSTARVANESPTYRAILTQGVAQAAAQAVGGAGSHWLIKAIEIGLKVVDSYL